MLDLAGCPCYTGVMRLDRTRTRLSKRREHEDDNFVIGTMEERLLMVWPITVELAKLAGYSDVERRLQRDVVCLAKRRR